MNDQESFAKRRPPIFSTPVDFSNALHYEPNKIGYDLRPNAQLTPIGSHIFNRYDREMNGRHKWSNYDLDYVWRTSTPVVTSYTSSDVVSLSNLSPFSVPFTPSPWSPLASTKSSIPSRRLSEFEDRLRPPYSAPFSTSLWPQRQEHGSDCREASQNGETSPTDNYRPPRMRRRLPSCVECVFCKNNGENPERYRTHILKDPEGIIMCPVLRAYNCPVCNNGGGDRAHTIRYCPRNRPQGWRQALKSS